MHAGCCQFQDAQAAPAFVCRDPGVLCSDPGKLWEDYLDKMSEDFQRTLQCGPEDRRVIYRTLADVDNCLQANGKRVGDYAGLPSIDQFANLANAEEETSANRLIEVEQSYDH